MQGQALSRRSLTSSVLPCSALAAFRPVAPRRTPPQQQRSGKGCVRACVAAVVTRSVEEVEVVEDQPKRPSPPQQATAFPAVLQTKLCKAHSSACTAALVLQDEEGEHMVATASLDKTMACWRFYTTQVAGPEPHDELEVQVTRLKIPGSPVFSLAKMPTVLPDGTVYKKPRSKPPGLFLGTANKEVRAWLLGKKDVTDKVVLGGHTGWVRSLAITDKWLFSCGCNVLRVWDTTFPSPKECKSIKLFTGDILSIAASKGRVFTAGADGSLRSWRIVRQGDLEEGPRCDKAHGGARVAACLVHEEAVYTVGYDGSVKAWSADTLELIAEARSAHKGEKVLCMTMAANGVLYTGGDDKLVRAWSPQLMPLGSSAEGHAASIRVLSAGRRGLLVSGDADGNVCYWEVVQQAPQPPVDPAPPAHVEAWALASASMDEEPLAALLAAPAPAPGPVAAGAMAQGGMDAACAALPCVSAVDVPEVLCGSGALTAESAAGAAPLAEEAAVAPAMASDALHGMSTEQATASYGHSSSGNGYHSHNGSGGGAIANGHSSNGNGHYHDAARTHDCDTAVASIGAYANGLLSAAASELRVPLSVAMDNGAIEVCAANGQVHNMAVGGSSNILVLHELIM